jgi:hypothetical protein
MQSGNSITPKYFSSPRVEELSVIFTLFNPSNSASFFPIFSFSNDEVFEVKLNNSSKVKLRSKEWTLFFQRIQQQNYFVAILNQSLQLCQTKVPLFKIKTKPF